MRLGAGTQVLTGPLTPCPAGGVSDLSFGGGAWLLRGARPPRVGPEGSQDGGLCDRSVTSTTKNPVYLPPPCCSRLTFVLQRAPATPAPASPGMVKTNRVGSSHPCRPP